MYSLIYSKHNKCVTTGFNLYLRSEGASDFWNDSGCNTIHFENGSVMCSCNHLTHFGVILSPELSDNNNDNVSMWYEINSH